MIREEKNVDEIYDSIKAKQERYEYLILQRAKDRKLIKAYYPNAIKNNALHVFKKLHKCKDTDYLIKALLYRVHMCDLVIEELEKREAYEKEK